MVVSVLSIFSNIKQNNKNLNLIPLEHSIAHGNGHQGNGCCHGDMDQSSNFHAHGLIRSWSLTWKQASWLQW